MITNGFNGFQPGQSPQTKREWRERVYQILSEMSMSPGTRVEYQTGWELPGKVQMGYYEGHNRTMLRISPSAVIDVGQEEPRVDGSGSYSYALSDVSRLRRML